MGLLDPQALEYFGLLGQSMLAGQSPNAGVNIGNAMMYADTEMRRKAAEKARLEEERQQAKMRDMQMQKLLREEKFNQVAFTPGQAPVPFNDAMGDGSGGMIPGQGPQFNYGAAAAVDPMRAWQLQREMTKSEAPQILAPGAAAFDPRTKQRLYGNEKPPELPAGMRMGPNGPEWIPEYIKGKKDLAAAGAPNVSVNTGTQENAFSKEYGKSLAESYGSLMKADLSASSTLNNLSRLESLLKSSGKTGKLTPSIMELKSLAASLGVDVGKETDFQKAALALSNQMALELRNPAGGAGMPGALSDKDREFLVGMTAGIDKMPNANALIIESRRRLAKREKDVARMARDYRKKNGRFDEGFYQELATYSEANPLFGDLVDKSGAANGNELQDLFNEARRRGLVKDK